MSNDDLKPQSSPPEPKPSGNPTDAWLAKSLQQLPQIQVPANFLPNVMFKVYEKHSRNLISWPKLIGFAGLLLSLSILFFIWDVRDHMVASGEATFSNAFAHKMDNALSGSQQFMADLGGLFTAAWQITLSALGAFFTQTSYLLQVTVLLVLIATVILLKKGWSKLA